MQKNPEVVRFNILRNALYHSARRRSLERMNRGFNFLVVVLGTAAFGDLTVGLGISAGWIGAAVAVIGALQLVFDFGRQARDHQALQKAYFELLADVEAKLEPGPEDAANWQAKMMRITADEPPVYKAIDAKAYNDAIDAVDWDQEERLHVPLWDRLLASIWALDGRQYEKIREINARREAKHAAREAKRAGKG
ncbi:hypothetical protein [Citreimonas sp.]|uniref:hypothetical protein n=1 Tax=Citreimonas sp. TaxID=3036715 RepID=UPI0035C81770